MLLPAQVLQMLPQRPQLHKLTLAPSQFFLALQQFILLQSQLLTEYLLFIAHYIKVLFQSNHVLI